MNCIIVDDEPLAIKVIESHLREFKDIKLLAKCRTALQAFEVLQNEKVDLMFLDIEMPKLDGLSFLKTLKDPPVVVITTAHRNYAIEGFELDVADYLLKPISLERIMQAIRKAKRTRQSASTGLAPQRAAPQKSDEYIFIRSERENIKVELSSILFIESVKNHVRIVTLDASFITLAGIGKMEERLPSDIFLRIHRSYLVNLDHIKNYTSTYVVIRKKSIPLGNSYKKRVLEFLEQRQL